MNGYWTGCDPYHVNNIIILEQNQNIILLKG